MTRKDVEMVLSWAAKEGWNPGLSDADAFYTADPEGFFVNEFEGAPVAAISVVNHDEAQSFLGLYICREPFRGRGFGLDVWREGLRHAGHRTIGLDGVPAQQANYLKSGFTLAGETVRYQGTVDARAYSEVREATAQDLEDLLNLDARVTGYARSRYLSVWFAPSPSRKTFVILRGDKIAAVATARACQQGHKIGPLYATTEQDTLMLMQHAADAMGNAPCFVDIPGSAPDFANLVLSAGFEPVFNTARMYRGTPPAGSLPPFHGVTTLELG